MHITKIELEDIKSHQAATFDFERGTTAITGANGAGKTTIIEAVAWTLFDLLDYKKDDFVRRGARKGVVNVTFESGLDERQYRVYRDTGTGYYIYDIALKNRIADKKEEVTRFLWQHLGVEAGTDLEALFRRAIGVPQGTFTAIFLETAAERKKAFDKLLKVEEYRQGADKLLETSRYIELQIVAAREKIARAEGELARYETVEAEHKIYAAQVAELTAKLATLDKEITEKSSSVKQFDEVEKQVNELKTAFEKLNTEKIRAEILLEQKLNELNQAKNAAEKIKVVRADYEKHLSALGKLKELERERSEREKLNQEKSKIENAQVNVKADQKRFQENLEKSLNASREISVLKPKIAEQEIYEKQRETLRNDVANAQAVENQISSLDAKMNDLREKFVANKSQIKDSEAKSANAAQFENLNRRDTELTNEIAKLRAKLEADERFQSEIKNGLCPILSQKCLNLKPGETLEKYVSSQFTEVKTQISTFETEKKQLVVALKNSREAEKSAAQLETLQSREREIGDEGKSLKEEKTTLEKRLENLPQLKNDLAKVETELKNLDNPKAKIRLLENEAKREIELREKLTEIEKNIERLESDREITLEKLESYKDLDVNWARYSGEREATANAHREFLTNENTAKTLSEREKIYAEAETTIAVLREDSTKAETEYESANRDYDRDRHSAEKFALAETEKRQTETRTNLENVQKRETQLAEELNRLTEIRKAMQSEFQEKERLEKVGEATAFIRETLKEAAPRVAKNYVFHVSMEANQMFREISGNAERTLKWTEDYGIVLEENGYERPFVNLSGGEQMSAALSVRLALLKQLSDVRLAFFDEPTTNMDAERRERLAEQISQITQKRTFDQLFIISHDDTFDEYADHVVSVTGEVNE
jgi:DNA repair protein SbcC/Rad50